MGRRRGEAGNAPSLVTGVRMLLFHSLHGSLGKKTAAKASSCVVSQAQPRASLCIALLPSHNWVGGKLGKILLTFKMLTDAPGAVCCPASHKVSVAASQGCPRRSHVLQSSTSGLGQHGSQRGAPSHMWLWQSRVFKGRDNEGLIDISKIVL